MRRHAGQNQSGNASRGYATLLILVAAMFVLFVVWPSDGSWSSGGTRAGSATNRVLEAMLNDNDRLQSALDSMKQELAQAKARALGDPCPACDCHASVQSSSSDCGSKVSSLQREVELLRTELAIEKDKREAAERRAASGTGTAVARTAGGQLEVPSCAHQKLEFLRWEIGPDGKEKKCPFTPENYENWTKLPPFCDYISIECLGPGNLRAAHVFGFGGPSLMIGYADVMMWEFVFARHKKPKHMIELGTMSGGTSLYWGMAANVRGGEFHTFDLNDNRASEPKRGWLPNMHFHKEDILSNVNCNDPSTHNPVVVESHHKREPMLALYDNGNKKKETDCYARYLLPGSVLLLHDWEHLDLPKPHWEMTYSYVKETLESLGFEKAYFDFSEHIGSSTRAFIRR